MAAGIDPTHKQVELLNHVEIYREEVEHRRDLGVDGSSLTKLDIQAKEGFTVRKCGSMVYGGDYAGAKKRVREMEPSARYHK